MSFCIKSFKRYSPNSQVDRSESITFPHTLVVIILNWPFLPKYKIQQRVQRYFSSIIHSLSYFSVSSFSTSILTYYAELLSTHSLHLSSLSFSLFLLCLFSFCIISIFRHGRCSIQHLDVVSRHIPQDAENTRHNRSVDHGFSVSENIKKNFLNC